MNRPMVKVGLLALLLGTGFAHPSINARQRLYLQPANDDRFLRSETPNLIIRISNVTDSGRTVKNYVSVFIDGQRIPAEAGILSVVVFSATLKPGAYKITARYTTLVNGNKSDYPILTPQDSITIESNRRITLSAAIQKDESGLPLFKQFTFTKTSAPLIDTPAITEIVTMDSLSTTPVSASQTSTTVLLQINTIPVFAKVIIDDRYYGQAPLAITVDRTRNHVVQLFSSGYQATTKLVQVGEMVKTNLVQIIETLQPE